MLVASEVKGELARIQPSRHCCRRAELAGLLYGDRADPGALVTLDRATARVAVQLAASLGLAVSGPRAPAEVGRSSRGHRHHLRVGLEADRPGEWRWSGAPDCDRRSFLRGALLAIGSISIGPGGPHVEFVFRSVARANELRRRLAESDVRSAVLLRRGRRVVYVKGHANVASLLALTGAHRGLLDLETALVGGDVRSRLNRLLNAESANVSRAVQAADRQLRAIDRLEEEGLLARLPRALAEAALERRRHPDADLDTLAGVLLISRSATNHRLRRLVELAGELDETPAPARG